MQVEEAYCNYHLDFDNCPNMYGKKDIPPLLKDSIKNIVEKVGYTTYNLDVKLITADGGNYLATLMEVNLKGKTKKGEKETNIFVKNIIPDEHFSILSIKEAYFKEMFAYNELFRIYSKLQEEANIPLDERYKIIKSYDETNPEFIILENIAKKGFKTLNRFETISLRFAELSIQQLAKFHGLSFVLQQQRKDYFTKSIKTLKPGFIFNDEWKTLIENFSKIGTDHVDCQTKKKIENYIPTIIDKYPTYYTEAAPVQCLCHGDFRANNIMMKIDDGEITEVMPVDYQIIHYGCPTNDIFYFIFGATDQQFRKDHFEHIKNMYHETLKKFLTYFDMDVEDYFPKKIFEKLCRERIEYGLMTAISFLPIILASEDQIPDFSKDCPATVEFKADKRIKHRLEGVVDDFVQWGFL